MKAPAPRREVLFLQGLPGGFFGDLADALEQSGHGVHKIAFNGGDWLTWRRWGAVCFTGGASRWPAVLAGFIVRRGVTDLVLFGDCRPMHRTARSVASGLGVAVHVFEEGYLRPDWVTLEQGGVNGFSPLPTDPDWYRSEASRLQEPEARPALPSSLAARVGATVAYYAAVVLLAWAFPLYRTHRPWNPALEGWGWLRRLLRRGLAGGRRADPAGLKPGGYFVLPLQLNSDSQLRAHSDFESMQPALARTIASFAHNAPPETRLVVKQHPLDNGLEDWRGQTLSFARALGVGEQVVFVEDGDINVLLRQACGVVTVNSTTGALALAAGVPVIALGRAVYALPGLTHGGSLEAFWTAPQAPDVELYRAFRRVLAHRCLLWGGFYDRAHRRDLVAAAAVRILSVQPDPRSWAIAAVRDRRLRQIAIRAPAVIDNAYASRIGLHASEARS